MRMSATISRALLASSAASALACGLLKQQEPSGSMFASGVVEATEAHLGFETPGKVEAILVQEGDSVRAAAALAYLERDAILARRQEAEARIAADGAALAELKAGFRPEEIAQARAALDAAQDRLSDAERDLVRTRRLQEGGAVSQEDYDKALLARDVARSQLAQAREALQLLERGPRVEKIQAQQAQLSQAEAALRVIDATLADMTLASPFDGVVTVRHSEPGETVAAGAPVLTIMNPDDRWVRIYIPENRMGAVKLGMPATITTDTYPEKTYAGEVRFIASEAEFTPKNVQTQEERVKLVYAVKVQITGDGGHDLKPGVPADVRLKVDDRHD